MNDVDVFTEARNQTQWHGCLISRDSLSYRTKSQKITAKWRPVLIAKVLQK
jgi:hypothetical protein